MLGIAQRQEDRLPEPLLRGAPEVILASASPRRQELFERLGLPFSTQEADLEEVTLPGETPPEFALRMALDKAMKVGRQRPDAWVVGADTVVVGMGRILGKPRDAGQAAAMLALLSGRTHRVLTGVGCVRRGRRPVGFVECSRVTFHHLRGADIDAYVRGGEPLDKAGAYGIQGGAAKFVRRLEGSYTNVVGLPLERLREVFLSILKEQAESK